jgi:molybdopterin synthase sulfur carrier subunit
MFKMKVLVKLYATLRKFAPEGTEIGEPFEVVFQGTTLDDFVKHLGFSTNQAKIVMVNGERILDMNHTLADDDLVVIFPPVGGG